MFSINLTLRCISFSDIRLEMAKLKILRIENISHVCHSLPFFIDHLRCQSPELVTQTTGRILTREVFILIAPLLKIGTALKGKNLHLPLRFGKTLFPQYAIYLNVNNLHYARA